MAVQLQRVLFWLQVVGVLVAIASCSWWATSRHLARLTQVEPQVLASQQQRVIELNQQRQQLQAQEQLAPVWDNWQALKSIALEHGLHLRLLSQGTRMDSARGIRNRSAQRVGGLWLGELRGKSLQVLAVANEMQQQIPLELLQFEVRRNQSRLEFRVLGR